MKKVLLRNTLKTRMEYRWRPFLMLFLQGAKAFF